MNAYEKKAYKLVQQVVCKRNPFCQRCGAGPVSGHHVFGRKNHDSCFDPDSCIALCSSCHDGWARVHPAMARELLRETIGEERYTHLAYLSSQVVRLREKDFRDIAEGLRKQLEGMG